MARDELNQFSSMKTVMNKKDDNSKFVRVIVGAKQFECDAKVIVKKVSNLVKLETASDQKALGWRNY